MGKVFLLTVLLCSSFAFAGEDDLPLVGLEKDGTPVEVVVSKKAYQQKFTQVINSVNESTLPVVEKRNGLHGWSLRTVVVGITVSLEAGFTPIFKLGLLPRFRVLFSNSKDAVYP